MVRTRSNVTVTFGHDEPGAHSLARLFKNTKAGKREAREALPVVPGEWRRTVLIWCKLAAA